MKRKPLIIVRTTIIALTGCSVAKQENNSAKAPAAPTVEEIAEATEAPRDEETSDTGAEQTEVNKNMSNTAKLMFHSFDGGGPKFSVIIDDPEIVSSELSSDRTVDPNSTETGTGYRVICTLTGLKPGKTNVTVQERSPIADNLDHIYTITVSDNLNVTTNERGAFEVEGVLADIKMFINDKEVPVKWLWNDTTLELYNMLPLTIKMSMYSDFEQVGSLSDHGSLPSSDERITTMPGDIVLYSGDQLVVFYGSNTWEYTSLGFIGLPEDELISLLGNGDVTIRIE